MVWACGKNGRVPDGQKGVDGQNKWRVGVRETKVRLDGWCDGGLGQQEMAVEAACQCVKYWKEWS